ncbi:MAG: cisplatin damage response ATP-dependent DNA ligase [Pirellulales bacterium]
MATDRRRLRRVVARRRRRRAGQAVPVFLGQRRWNRRPRRWARSTTGRSNGSGTASAQIIRRAGQTLVWTRGEELVTDRYPEAHRIGDALPDGTVLDGELLAWRGEAPLPFAVLQRRIGRKTVGPRMLVDAPVAFLAYDVLEERSADLREQPLSERRATLERIVAAVRIGEASLPLKISDPLVAGDWTEVARLREHVRDRLCEGVMLKRRTSAYGVGRTRGDWWKWKSTPLTIDAVLVYAQQGHGRRASLFTDYTFAVWDGDELVPVAKAYSGLTDAEIRDVDRFIRANTINRFGPVSTVKAELVFELNFEGIQVSSRHKAGLAVRFPRIARQRPDKPMQEADTLETLRNLAESLSHPLPESDVETLPPDPPTKTIRKKARVDHPDQLRLFE